MSMEVKEFSDLLERVLKDIVKSGNLTAVMSRPDPRLIQLYGPMTDKFTRDKAFQQGQRIYDTYLQNTRGDTKFWKAYNKVVQSIELSTTNVTSSEHGVTTKLLTSQKNCFDALTNVIEQANTPHNSRAQCALLAAGDLMIIGSLSLIPVVGPAVCHAMNTVLSQVVFTGAASVATAAVGAASSGITKTPNSSTGIVTLCHTGLALVAEAQRDKIARISSANGSHYHKITNMLSQNQAVAGGVNAQLQNTYKTKIDSLFIDQANKFTSANNLKANHEDTIANFVDRARDIYESAFAMIDQVINSGIAKSFDDETKKFKVSKHHDKSEMKLALLIMGYFYAKQWDGKQQKPQNQDPSEFKKIANKMTTQGHMSASAKDVLQLASTATKRDYFTSRNVDPSFHDFKSGSVEADELLVERVAEASIVYFAQLKRAIAADIESSMTLANSAGGQSPGAYTQMWQLYLGSLLIVSHSIRDALQKNAEATKAKNINIRHYNAFAAPPPQTTPTMDGLPRQYVELIKKADFIESYTAFLGLSKSDKIKHANTGKIRRASIKPSDNEDAMLVIFCSMVVYTMDIGGLALGTVKWEDQIARLRTLCKIISMNFAK